MEMIKDADLAQQMRLGMRRLASSVSVVTGSDFEGNRLAMTASSITSVSDSPASLLVCIQKSSYLCQAVRDTGIFCINLLSDKQQEISIRCASPDESLDRFALGSWQQDLDSGLYYLMDAQAVFHCTLSNELEHGTHFIFVGDIQAVRVAETEAKPLMYLNGQYVKAVTSP